MKNVMKKLTAWLCCMALLVTMLPVVAVPAMAAEGTALTATSGTLSGSYYLSGDLVLTGTFGVKSDVTVDLNGHTISMKETVDKAFFDITAAGHLTIKDSASGGKVQFKTTTEGAPGVNVVGKFTLESGTLTGWKRADKSGGAVFVKPGGTFTMNGGAITKCEAPSGSAIRVEGAGAVVNINNGVITGNNCNNEKNNSVVDVRGTADGTAILNINGGTIAGNTRGGGPIRPVAMKFTAATPKPPFPAVIWATFTVSCTS